PKWSISQPGRGVAGTEPTATQRSATPSSAFDAPVARCTLGRSDAQAPQKRPSAPKPAMTGLDDIPAFRKLRERPGRVGAKVLPPRRERPRRQHALGFGADLGRFLWGDDASPLRLLELVLVEPFVRSAGPADDVQLEVEVVEAGGRAGERALEVHVPLLAPAAVLPPEQDRVRRARRRDAERLAAPDLVLELPLVAR